MQKRTKRGETFESIKRIDDRVPSNLAGPTGGTLKLVWALICAVLASAIVIAVAQPASAAYTTYANHVPKAHGSTITSSAYTNINGGRVGARGIGISEIFLQIRTFNSHPGYKLHGQASGPVPGYVYLYHPRVSGASYSQCNWYFSFQYNIGNVPLTC